VSGVVATNTVGPLTVTNTTIDLSLTQRGLYGVRVDGGAGGLVTIKGSQISPATFAANDTYWYGISVKDTPSFVIDNNTFNGLGVTSSYSPNSEFFRFENSNGTATGNQIVLAAYNQGTVVGFHVIGPSGAVTIDDATISGGGLAPSLTFMYLDTISNGLVTIRRGNFSHTANGSGTNTGLRTAALYPSGFVLTDSTIKMGLAGSGGNYGFNLNDTPGRIERSRFIMGSGGSMIAGNTGGLTQLELYDSYLYGGFAATGGSCNALIIGSSTTLYASGNTLDGGGKPNDGTSSTGFECDNASVAYLTSNLVAGGQSTTHRMLTGNGTTTCIASAVASNFKNNYFWYSGAGGENGPGNIDMAHTIATATNIGDADGNGNIIGGTTGCYDTLNFSQPDYHIAAGSPCIDKGATALRRRDASAITTDLDGNARVLGAAADVGCSEKQ
jgi:hypothetical protein